MDLIPSAYLRNVPDIIWTPSVIPVQGRKESTMKIIIKDDTVLLRAPEGPLAAHISTFAQSLRAQGYAVSSIHRQVLLAACFMLMVFPNRRNPNRSPRSGRQEESLL